MGLRAILGIALAALSMSAQTLPALEIKGRVIEPGLEIGIAGAEVTLIEFVVVESRVTRSTFATAFTDSSGAFRFQPLRLGNYYVEVKKEGYHGTSSLPGLIGGDGSDTTEAAVTLSRERPSQEIRFTMIRPGEITGRVLDEDRQPLAGLMVAVQQRSKVASFAELTTTTGEDGSFRVLDVPPGEFFVRISPESGDLERVRTQFSPEEAAVIDQDIETAFWPGGTSAPSTNPVQVSSGAFASIGTVIVRKIPYYRVQVSVPGECALGEKWSFSAFSATLSPSGAIKVLNLYGHHENTIACAPKFLVENLTPGSYLFLLRDLGRTSGKSAQVPVEITSRNLDIDVTLSPGTDIIGRFTAAEGAQLPPLGTVRIQAAFILGTDTATPDADGTFNIHVQPWPRRQITVMGLPTKYYVKEIRYNGRAAEQGLITATPGAQMEIIIDDKAAGVTGSVTSGDKLVEEGLVVAMRWPLPDAEQFNDTHFQTGIVPIRQAKFQFMGLAPGEYRIASVPLSERNRLQDWTTLNQLLSRVETTRLGASESRTLTLELIR